MKKFQTWLVGIALSGVLISTVSFASFTGGSTSISLPDIITGLTGIFAKLDLANVFTESQTIEVDGVDPREGLNITKDGSERTAICHSRDPANGGQSRSWCWESTDFISRIIGNANNVFGTSTSSTIIQTFDYNGGGRVNMTPTGSMGVSSGNSGAFNSNVEFSVGGTTNATSTFLVDATNGWMKILPNPSLDFNPFTGDCLIADTTTHGIIAYDAIGNTPYICTASGFQPMVYTPPGNTVIDANNASLITAAGGGTVLFDGIAQWFWTGTAGGNMIGMFPIFAPPTGEITASCQLMGGAGTFQRSFPVPSAGNMIYTAGIQPCEIVKCEIRGTDTSYPFKYTQTWNHTCDSATSSSQYMTLKSRLSFGN